MTVSAAALLGLFASAFLAATLLPAQSEAVLVGLLLAHPASVAVLIATASLGNTLGAMVDWLLGLAFKDFVTSDGFQSPRGSLSALKGNTAALVAGLSY